jgi:hypothetical protein
MITISFIQYWHTTSYNLKVTNRLYERQHGQRRPFNLRRNNDSGGVEHFEDREYSKTFNNRDDPKLRTKLKFKSF